MATYTISCSQVVQLFRYARRRLLVAQCAYPLASFAVAAWLARTWPTAAAVLLGMGLAWLWSLLSGLRYISSRYRAYLAQPDGILSFEITPDGVRWKSPAGEGAYRWHAISLETYRDAFVIRDNARDVALIPKRLISADDLALIEANRRGRRTSR